MRRSSADRMWLIQGEGLISGLIDLQLILRLHTSLMEAGGLLPEHTDEETDRQTERQTSQIVCEL